jgi:hypothetical protein
MRLDRKVKERWMRCHQRVLIAEEAVAVAAVLGREEMLLLLAGWQTVLRFVLYGRVFFEVSGACLMFAVC